MKPHVIPCICAQSVGSKIKKNNNNKKKQKKKKKKNMYTVEYINEQNSLRSVNQTAQRCIRRRITFFPFFTRVKRV